MTKLVWWWTALWAASCVRAPVAPDAGSPARLVDLDQPRPGDARKTRALVLDNGLEILLVSDPKLPVASAALSVDAGSHEDPEGRPGMAHYLEHMLFLGTDKYPDEAEFDTYLQENGGYSNAYTADEHTNYFFEVRNDAFEGALDRFAQFFVAPKFTPAFVEREIRAVDSEHAKNLQDDDWRARRVFWSQARADHPQHRFSTGTSQTLAGVTPEEVRAFYEAHYSAELMHLAVMAQAPLDTLETWARERFGAVPDRDLTTPEYSPDLFDDSLPRQIFVEPVSDRREMTLSFPIPPTQDRHETKPARLLGALIGHEGTGSLLSQLKAEGLAVALGTSVSSQSYRDLLQVDIALTAQGLEKRDRVVELLFAYVQMLRDTGLERYFYEEQRIMGDLDFVFRDPVQGAGGAAFLAREMRTAPPLLAERQLYTYGRYAPEEVEEYAGYLRPDNLVLLVMAPGLPTDQVEPWYGTSFSVAEVPEDTLARWAEPAEVPALRYPEPNPFIPSDLTLLDGAPEGPQRVLAEPLGEVWLEQDRRFQLPRALLDLTVLTPAPSASPRARAAAELYVRAVEEGLNEWRYLGVEAGLYASLGVSRRGLELAVEGYSQRLPDYLVAFGERMAEVTIDEATFADLRDELARDLVNQDRDQAYLQVLEDLGQLDPHAMHRRTWQGLVPQIGLDEVRAFGQRALAQASVQGVAYGNLDGATLAARVRAFHAAVADAPLPQEAWPPPPGARVVLPEGARVAVARGNATDNHAWLRWVQVGPRTPAREAALRVAELWLGSPFYAELRTRQQLGYIVGSGASVRHRGQGLYFVLQSAEYPSDVLAERASAFLAQAAREVGELPAERFEGLRQAAIDAVRKPPADMSEALSRRVYEAVGLGGDFAWNDKVVGALGALTREELAATLRGALLEGGERLDLYLAADGAEVPSPPGTVQLGSIEALSAYRADLATF